MNKDTLRKLVWSVCVVTFILVLSFAFIGTSIMAHDFKLWRMEQAFRFAMEHPFASVLVQRDSYVGTLYESGDDHCNFFVGEIRTARVPKEKIVQKYTYRDAALDVFGFARNISIQVSFMDEWPSLRLDKPIYQWMKQYIQQFDTETEDVAYVVYAADYRNPPWGDYRCWD